MFAYKGRPFSVFVDGFESHFALGLLEHSTVVEQQPCTVLSF